MPSVRRFVVPLVTLLCVTPVASTHATASLGILELVSTNATGAKGSGTSASISSDGTRVAFVSGSNMHPDDTELGEDVYVKDLTTGEVTVVSLPPGGQRKQAGHDSRRPAISGDGTVVAFESNVENLVPGIAPSDQPFHIPDELIYARNLVTDEIVRVSARPDGRIADNYAREPTIDATGTRIAFESRAKNLGGSTSVIGNVFVADLATGELTAVARNQGLSRNPSLAADGNVVAFDSTARDLDDADTDEATDVYVKDLTAGTYSLVSARQDGTKGNGDSFEPVISADGRSVGFVSHATNLDPRDTDADPDVYVKDLDTGELVLASITAAGTKARAAESFYGFSLSTLDIDADGSRVAFTSWANNLTPQDPDARGDIYVKDLRNSSLILASSSPEGAKGNDDSFSPSLTADGKRVAFHSSADNLHPADTDSVRDVYLRLLPDASRNPPPDTSRVSIGTHTGLAAPERVVASVSGDGDRLGVLVRVLDTITGRFVGQPLEIDQDELGSPGGLVDIHVSTLFRPGSVLVLDADRAVHVVPLAFLDDGTPVLGAPLSAIGPLAATGEGTALGEIPNAHDASHPFLAVGTSTGDVLVVDEGVNRVVAGIVALGGPVRDIEAVGSVAGAVVDGRLVGIVPDAEPRTAGAQPSVGFSLRDPRETPLIDIGTLPGSPDTVVAANGTTEIATFAVDPSSDALRIVRLDSSPVPVQQLVGGSITLLAADGSGILYNRAFTAASGFSGRLWTIGGASMTFDPQTVKVRSHGRWVTVRIEVAGGGAAAIDASTVRLEVDGTAGSVPVSSEPPPVLTDHDGDGNPDLEVRFDRTAVSVLLAGGTGATAVVRARWSFTDGTGASASAQIRVIR